MGRSFLRRTLWGTALLLLVIGLGGGGLVYRLARAPLDLGFLRPAIESALLPASGAYRLRIGGTWLRLDPPGRSLGVLARDVVLTDAAGGTIAHVPELDLGFSIRAALAGVIAPTRIVLHEPRLRLVREADGGFHLGFAQEGGGQEGGGQEGAGQEEAAEGKEEGNPAFAQDLLKQLIVPSDRSIPFGYLQTVAVTGASLEVEDRKLGLSWRVPHLRVSARKGRDGTLADASFALAIDGAEANLDGRFVYHRSARRIDASLGFRDWEPAKLARILPVLVPLGAARMPLGGRVALSIDATGIEAGKPRLAAAQAAFDLGAGSIVHPALPRGEIALAGGKLTATYDPENGVFRLDGLTLDLGGPKLTASGKVLGLERERLDKLIATGTTGADIDIGFEMGITGMPAAALERYWPPGLSPGAREWITANVRQGAIDEARLSAGLHLPKAPPAAAPDVELRKLEGGMRLRGLTISYRPPLAPVEGVDGTAVFDQKSLTITPTSGMVRSVRIKGGKILVGGLDLKDQDIAIDLDFDGALRDILEELDRKPFEYAKEIGISPKEVAGTAEGHAFFRFPLIRELKFRQVDYGAQAQLAGLGVRDALFGQDLEDGKFRFGIDRNALSLDGEGRLAGAPAEIVWIQSLRRKDMVGSRYTLRAKLDDAARARLGIAIPMLSLAGPVQTTAQLRNYRDGRGEADISFDLRAAKLGMALLGWSKPEDMAAEGQMRLLLRDGRLLHMRNAVIVGEDMDIRLNAGFLGSFATVQHIDFSRFRLGETALSGTLSRRGEGWDLQAEGEVFDGHALFENFGKGGTTEAEPPLMIDAHLGKVILGHKREAREVAAHLVNDGIHWQVIDVAGSPQGRGRLAVRLGNGQGPGKAEHPLSFETDNLGGSLSMFGVSDNVVGGRLTLTGQARDKGANRVFTGHFDGADYHVIHAPILAKILSLASFAGIDSLFSGDGIPFTRLLGDFSATPGIITLKRARAFGGAIGVTADGKVDLGQGTVDLSGTVVPAYTLNSILGNIPILGNLLLGGEGEGIFGANYRLAGSSDDPKISVNPLSALAPGFLRKLFLFDPGNPAGDEPPKP